MCYSALLRQDLKEMAIDYDATVDQGLWDSLYESEKRDPRKIKLPDAQGRIFPLSYAAVIAIGENGSRLIRPMRYAAYPPPYLDPTTAQRLTTYNARRDSLGKRFWEHAFGVNHGIVILRAFYEWVKVSDLVAAGRVSISEVRREFERQSLMRRKQIEAQGKAYRPTATEKSDALFRKIVICFRPQNLNDLVVPVIISKDEGTHSYGFAIVTDEPTDEIRAAGHDRMPVILSSGSLVEDWLHPSRFPKEKLMEMLETNRELSFVHELPEAS